jgi:hypothetical protein
MSSAIKVVGGISTFTPPREYTYTLYVFVPPSDSPNLLRPSLAGQSSATAGFTGVQESVLEDEATGAQDDAQAQLYIAEQESILQAQYDVGVGNSITTMDPQDGSNSVSENSVGQATSVPVDFSPITRVVTASGAPGAAAGFTLSFPEGVNGVNTLADTPDPVTVTALDSSGNVVTDYTGTVTLASSDPQFGQPITYTYTSADQGSHTFYAYLDTAGIESLMVTQTDSGTQSGQALGQGQMGPLDSTVNGHGLVDIMPDAAYGLVLDAPSTITAGSAVGFTVTALDAFGNVATGYTGTVSFSSQIGGATITGLPGSYTFTSADQGSHMFAIGFKAAGSQTIIAYDDSPNSIIPDARVGVQIMAAPAKLVITTQPQTVVTAGNNFDVVVEAVDSHGKPDSNFNGLVTMTLAGNPAHGTLGGVVTVQAVNGVATFSGLTLNKAGAGYSLLASSGSVTTATTRAISVTVNTASKFVVISQPPSNVTAGNPFGLKVVAEDLDGNLVSSFSGSVTLALAGGPSGATVAGKLTVTLVKGVATFTGLKITQAGTGYTLTAIGSTLTTATTNPFNVTAGAATQLAIDARPQDSVVAGRGFGLAVTALDAYGNVASTLTAKVTLVLANNPGLSKLGGQVTVKAVNGVASFSGLTLNNPGIGYTIKTKSGRLSTAVTNLIDVS